MKKFFQFLSRFSVKQPYIVWLLPWEGPIRSIYLPARQITLIIYLVIFLIIGLFGYGLKHYQEFYQLRRVAGPIRVENRFLTSELNRLHQAELKYQVELDRVLAQAELERRLEAEALTQVYLELARIKDFVSDLKVLAGFKLPISDVPEADQGGPELPITDYYSSLEHYSGPELIAGLAERRRALLGLMDEADEELIQLWDYLKEKPSILSDVPRGYPVEGCIKSGFGPRGRGFHPGVDIAAPNGTPIRAPAQGVVVFAGYQGSYGKLVILDHGQGYTTRYGHLSKIQVSRGDRVARGAVIGRVGSSGRATGPHLHYEIRLNEVPVNPSRYLK
jgi:murein DD-endopeptidase MepM/ murein hydrolase activator NlpD